MRDHFPPGVTERLRYYVYRLIDPRNGETFYVGKGLGDRVFQHALGLAAYEPDQEPATLKLQRIKEIRSFGFDVAHVVHRHGLDETTAFEVEAALIDAYPGLTNIQGGHYGLRGVAHVEEIVARYEARPLVPQHRLLAISIGLSFESEEMSIYEATRFAWRVSVARARSADFVLAVRGGIVVGVFTADAWHPATREHFPDRTTAETSNRWAFVGRDAPLDIRTLYFGTRIPDHMRRRGAANPIRFLVPEEAPLPR